MKTKNQWLGVVLLLGCTPLFLGTTFVIMEKGVEVGRWIEQDGEDKVTYLDPDERLGAAETVERQALLQEMREEYQPIPPVKELIEDSKAVEPREKGSAYLESVAREKRYWQEERERRQAWSIIKGMTTEQVAAVARKKGVARTRQYKKSFEPIGNWYRIYEYRFDSENYSHTKLVYFDLETDRVLKVTHENSLR